MRRCRRCGSGAPEAQLNQGRMLRTLASKDRVRLSRAGKGASRLRKGEPRFSRAWKPAPGGQAGSSSGNLTIQPEAGFTGGQVTLTVGVNQQPATLFTLFGNLDSDPTNDTVSYDIPAAS